MSGPGWYLEWVAAWMRRQARRGRAKASLDTWTWALRDLGRYLLEQGVGDIEGLDRAALQGWQETLRVRLSPASQQVAVGTVRSLLRWADREQRTARSGLGEWLELPKVPTRLPRPLDPETLRLVLRHYTLVKATPDGKYGRRIAVLEQLRDRALFRFLVTSGARISEALQVDVTDVGAGRILVRQKGGAEQLLVPSSGTRAWIAEYVRARGRDGEPALWVFVRGPRRRRLSAREVNAIWRQLAGHLEVPAFTSHQLRHTAATELLERGATEVDVQQQLGHAGLATVHKYVKVRRERRQRLADLLDDLVPDVPETRPAILRRISRRRARPPGRSA